VILIDGVTAITVDRARRVVFNAAILIEGDRIVAIDDADALAGARERADVIDGRGKVAVPGFIDTHAHADQSLLRGIGDDLHWIPFLADVIIPYIAHRTPRDVVVAYRLSILEMLRSGTTCFVSPNVSPGDDLGGLTGSIAELGIRAVLARYVTPTGEAEGGTAEAGGGLEPTAEAIATWDGAADGRISLWFGLHTPRQPGDLYQPSFYPAVAAKARELGTRVVYHFSSEREDAEYYETTFGMPAVQWARDNDALGENVLLINACQVSPAEIELLAETGTHVAHSPVANMKMATGIAPLVELADAGVNVSLGTDGGANNNSHDMLAEMKAACLLQNVSRGRAGALKAERALEMATIGGARAIGRAHDLGSLEPGKLADVVLLDCARPNTAPALDPVSTVVYSANPANVDTVIIGGSIVVRGGAVENVNEREVVAEAQAAAARLTAGHLGLESSRREEES
jgi:5-methylthioadenosine/S-adenosylhomocysteine deaminase